MNKTVFEIKKMDCPSEESLIRVKLDGLVEVKNLEFDIPNRKLTVFHNGGTQKIEGLLGELNLGSSLLQAESVDDVNITEENDQRKLLWTVLGINFLFFFNRDNNRAHLKINGTCCR